MLSRDRRLAIRDGGGDRLRVAIGQLGFRGHERADAFKQKRHACRVLQVLQGYFVLILRWYTVVEFQRCKQQRLHNKSVNTRERIGR